MVARAGSAAGDSAPEDRHFTRTHRLSTNEDYRQVFANRCSSANDTLIVYTRRNGTQISRLGLSVSRKVGNAVCRNRWKRRIREAFRIHRAHLPVGFDFVAIPRRGAIPNWQAIERSVTQLFPRAARKADSTKARDGT